MKVYLVANHASMGGGEVMLLNTAQALQELQHDPIVVCPSEPSDMVQVAQSMGFSVHPIMGSDGIFYLIKIFLWSLRCRHELIWCHGLKPALALVGRSCRFVHFHQKPAKKHRIFAILAAFRALGIYVPSKFMASQIKGSKVLYNWTRSDFQSSEGVCHDAALSKKPFTFLFLGRITRSKGVHVLLEAYARLQKNLPTGQEVQLIVAGEPKFVSTREATQLMQAITATPGAEYVGWVDTAEACTRADVLVCPSICEESFGLVAAEAMGAGVAVIATDTGALPEVVGHRHPLLTPVGDAVALAENMQKIMQMPMGEHRDLLAAQHQRWCDKWSPQAGRERVAEAMDFYAAQVPAS